MSEFEYRAVDPEDFIHGLEETIRRAKEDKYAFQVGLKDLDFDVDAEKMEEFGLTVPFESIADAEHALRQGLITPTIFLEFDGTQHQVTAFDPQPVGFSGFMDCVTHSLSLTDQGLFEVGRYPAMSLESQHRYWQWFLHQRLATTERVDAWQEESDLSGQHMISLFYEVITAIPKARGEDTPFRFTLGQTVQTPGAHRAIKEADQHPMDFLSRHITGDWGELDDFDILQNEEALQHNLRLLSAYHLSTGQKLWVITEADRSATTLLLPEEY